MRENLVRGLPSGLTSDGLVSIVRSWSSWCSRPDLLCAGILLIWEQIHFISLGLFMAKNPIEPDPGVFMAKTPKQKTSTQHPIEAKPTSPKARCPALPHRFARFFVFFRRFARTKPQYTPANHPLQVIRNDTRNDYCPFHRQAGAFAASLTEAGEPWVGGCGEPRWSWRSQGGPGGANVTPGGASGEQKKGPGTRWVRPGALGGSGVRSARRRGAGSRGPPRRRNGRARRGAPRPRTGRRSRRPRTG